MRPPPYPHASPLPSFCVVPAPARRTPTFSESLPQIAAWWTGDRRSLKERIRERELIERLAEELAEAERAGQGEKP
jgi:hypothetical protein